MNSARRSRGPTIKPEHRGRPGHLAVVLLLLLVLLPGCGGGTAPEQGRSHKPAAPGNQSEAHFRFIVCGDPQNNYEVFGKVLEAAKSVDFLIITGDVTGSGTRTELQNFLDFMRKSGVRYYCVPGNHDVATSPAEQNYTAYLGQPYQSFDYQNSHFLLIDNSTPELGFYASEREWARKDLERGRGKGYEHTFAVCHVPPTFPYQWTYDPSHEAGVRANDELIPLLASGGVEELFCGHVHGFKQYRQDRVLVKITGGAGAPLLGSEDYYHYVLVEINGKNRTQQVIRI